MDGEMEILGEPCAKCGVWPGEPHLDVCTSTTCTICGRQLFQCRLKGEHFPEGNSIHNGISFFECKLACELVGLFDSEGRYDFNESGIKYKEALKRVWEMEGSGVR